MKTVIFISSLLFSSLIFAQSKNYVDQPYIETKATVDSLVLPDRIFLNILISEKDLRGRMSLEDLESKMIKKLEENGVDSKKQLALSDLSSNFKRYFLKRQDIRTAKLYSLLVYSANSAGKIMADLESENISNITLEKTEYSKLESLKLDLKSIAVKKAKQSAAAMSEQLNQQVGSALFISDSDTNSSSPSDTRIRIRGVSSIGQYNGGYKQPDIEFEKIKVSVTVNAIFKLD